MDKQQAIIYPLIKTDLSALEWVEELIRFRQVYA